jgi:hypothetical protein
MPHEQELPGFANKEHGKALFEDALLLQVLQVQGGFWEIAGVHGSPRRGGETVIHNRPFILTLKTTRYEKD